MYKDKRVNLFLPNRFRSKLNRKNGFVLVPHRRLAFRDAGNGLLTDLDSYWKHDETSISVAPVTRVDSHGSKDWTDVNDCASGTGILNNGSDFETGRSDYFTATGTAFSGATGGLTSTFWVKMESLGADTGLFRIYGSGDENGDSLVYIQYDISESGTGNANTIQANVFGNAANFSVGGDNNALNDTNWHHILVTAQVGGNMRLYIDGSEQADSPTSMAAATAFRTLSGTESMYLGRLRVSLPRYHDGILDEQGIYAAELNSTKRGLLYGGGTPPSFDTFD